ncbi:MAG: sigma-70 family RNA polymerase sigma factor [Anaerovibrio sp.]|uniref:sigma-70 family RNA polymerase sigma factor n=1 Tax=Anaerovibrio sp. TaxID=1872532 RepID=UPI0025D5CD13|nr:sigma-70 family RNA polymerase sigma factor [Anaerovibrio sp.]MCR5176199.1 sigma-70 family RNA polymerase sigma factor [Anaerovibrio sp.]
MNLADYVQELNKVKILEPDVERQLWHDFKVNHHMDARSRLIEAYQPLVFRTALPFRSLDNIMDVIQEGTVGLIESVESFDPNKGVAFSLYAVFRIRGRMYRFLKEEGRADIACLEDNQKSGGSLLDMLADTGTSVPEIAEIHAASDIVMEAMDRLPTREQLVLDQVYVHSKDVKSVADMMNVSTAHIYRLQKSGVRRIRGMLSKFMHNWK